MAYPEEIRNAAKGLYLKRWTPQEIKDELGLNSCRIIYYWAEKLGWRDLLTEEAVEDAIARRVQVLLHREKKNPGEQEELDRLIGHHVSLKEKALKWAEREQALKVQREQGHEPGPNRGKREQSRQAGGSRKGGKKAKNEIGHLTEADFTEWLGTLFGYQLRVREAKNDPALPRTRNILKSRQIGMTYYFAGEALEDAILTGGNQIFLSATRAQAEVFRSYICKIAQTFLGVTLTGNPIVLSNGAELHFCSTNSNSAQSRSGNVYIDEYFWIPNFEKLSDVASAMATQSHWRKTYFSTPSSKVHEAYRFWTGERWKGQRPSRVAIDFPGEDDLRDGGRVCPDRQWRYVITIEDAIRLGCHLIDIEELKDEYPEEVFDRLYMCRFIDDALSVFKFQDMERAGVDPTRWEDYKPGRPDPFGRREVWLGYDPSRTRDNATLVVIAPPSVAGERFRVLEKHYWRGLNFQFQAQEITRIAKKFRVTYLGVDVSGIGAGVFDLLKPVFKGVCHPINYSIESKSRLVLKMIDVVEANRIEWDSSDRDIPLAFLAIKRSTTGGGQMTFRAARDNVTGHADVFFAIAHAVANEPLDTHRKRKSTWATSQEKKAA
ncbi:terminase ATPase subunit family protein [Aeromonas dhakensis]|uniref:terminase ATPase subunit family protein n=1 Tax=Aeromonas dhakensis TaxID=196024 RepID=UPI0029D97612|nr:terminase ATPase subunit family protein [Aeromonas dhakensis]MDX7742267.1 terminase ATPase subunit family protein [Aeromonas dhakensis]